MKNKYVIGFFALLLALGLTACSDGNVQNNNNNMPNYINNSANTPMPAANADASFTDNLMHMTAGDGNRMLSPYSAKMCLALLANGAEDETKQQILDALGIDDLDAYNTEVKALLERYATYEGVMSLETANSIWLNQTVFGEKGAFLSDYQTAMQEYFSAEVREVTKENSVEAVNAWVNEKTHEKIDSIFTEDHRNFSLALVNAVYFKATWQNTFVPALTAEGDFTNIDGSQSRIDFMQSTDDYGYYAGNGVRAVRINYSRYGGDASNVIYADKNYSFSMYIMLCDDPEAELNVDAFLREQTPFSSSYVQLKLPKFEMEYSVSLVDTLKALGMTAAFDSEKADLGAMIDLSKPANNLFVSDVLQKTYIQVDEEGTEAAAVTAIAVTEAACIVRDEPIEFTADKPFYFAIRDNTSGELLFVGRYETAK